MNTEPKILILSSSEGLPIAHAVQAAVKVSDIGTRVWNQGVFPRGELLLNSIIRVIPECDETIIVITPDDIAQIRGASATLPRDNIILEIGLSIGALGLEHTHLLCPAGVSVKLPSDLDGLTYLTYDAATDESMAISIKLSCDQLMSAIRSRTKLGMRWDTFGRAVTTLNDMIMRNDVYGGFRPSIVVGVNPGGAIVGSILYYLNRDSFYFTTLWATENARLHPDEPSLPELINVARSEYNGIVRILLVDDGSKTGRNLKKAQRVVMRAAGDEQVVVKSAVLLHRPASTDANSDWAPDYYVFGQFTHFPYTEL